MSFAEALTEYLIDGLSEALAKVETPTPPVPLAADRYLALSALSGIYSMWHAPGHTTGAVACRTLRVIQGD